MIKIQNLTVEDYSWPSSSSESSIGRPSALESFGILPNDELEILSETQEPKAKAISILSNDTFEVVTPFSLNLNSGLIKPSLSRETTNFYEKNVRAVEKIRLSSSCYISDQLIESTKVRNLEAPPRPYLLLPSNFTTHRKLLDLVDLLTDLLQNHIPDVHYEFLESCCGFDAVYFRGSKYTDFSLRIYQNTGHDGLLVELQRLHHDSCAYIFRSIFEMIKNAVTGKSETKSLEFSMISFNAGGGSCGSSESSEEETIQSIESILKTATCSQDDQSRLETCRIICDMVEQPELRQHLASTCCVQLLTSFSDSKHSVLSQHAILALAQLSECQAGIKAILNAGVVPKLLEHARDGPFKTTAMRRESARVIANVASKKAAELLTTISPHQLSLWSSRISGLKDETIRDRSERAHQYLHTVMA